MATNVELTPAGKKTRSAAARTARNMGRYSDEFKKASIAHELQVLGDHIYAVQNKIPHDKIWNMLDAVLMKLEKANVWQFSSNE